MIGMSFREHPAGSAATTRVGVYRVWGLSCNPCFHARKQYATGFMVEGLLGSWFRVQAFGGFERFGVDNDFARAPGLCRYILLYAFELGFEIHLDISGLRISRVKGVLFGVEG